MARTFNPGYPNDFTMPANIVPITTPFTFSVFCYPTGTGDRSLAGTSSPGGVQIRINADNTIYLIKRAVAAILLSTATVTQTAWNHVAVTDTGTAQSITINGGTPAMGSTSVTYTAYTSCQYGTYTGEPSPSGAMADWTFWSDILMTGEIKALSSGVRPCNIRPKSLICYLPLDGLQSPEPDLSGNAFNATLSTAGGGPLYFNNPPVTMFTPRWPRNYDAAAAATVPLSQTHYRFRTDGDAVDATPTWPVDEDANGYNPDVNTFRIRFKIEKVTAA